MDAHTVNLGGTALRARRSGGLGVVLEGRVQDEPGAVTPYMDAVLDDPATREAFFQLVETEGLVVCRHLAIDPVPYRGVRGKRTRGRMSQGEFFHHDGCSTPTRPRIVEIRCPDQDCVRAMGTSVARFPEVVRTLLDVLPHPLLRTEGLGELKAAANAGEALDWEGVQGAVNRAIRPLDVETARALLREVDAGSPSFTEPWTLSESRFMANENPARTVQHRRAYPVGFGPGVPNGRLLKRWPAEELPLTASL
ncbi:MAG: hypothetical protein R3F61_25745 [Myxococcota bacterium]